MKYRNGLFAFAFIAPFCFSSLLAQENPPAAEKPQEPAAVAPAIPSEKPTPEEALKALQGKDQQPSPTSTSKTTTVPPPAASINRFKLLGPKRPAESRIAFSRGSVDVRQAYAEVASKALDATIRVFNGKDRAALGTVIAPEGLVLTKASEVITNIECELADGTKVPAKVVGIVSDHDLALLQLDLSKAAGRISYVNLFDGATPVVGTLLASPTPDLEPAAVGVLSAAPRAVAKQRGRIGVQLDLAANGPARIVVLYPNTPASRAKMAEGDIITSVQGVEVKTRDECQNELQKYEPGDTVKMAAKRGDQVMEFTLTLAGEAIFSEAQGRQNREEFQNRLGGDLSRRRVGFKSVIQHDTVLIPADCGGPLLDIDGNVIGINIARAGRVASFAVPSNIIRTVLPDMIAGKFAPRSDVDQQLQKLAQVEDELLKKIGALRNVLSGEPDEEEPENSKPVEAILPDDEKMKIEKQIGELEAQLTKVRSELQLLEAKKSGDAPPAVAPETQPAAPPATDK